MNTDMLGWMREVRYQDYDFCISQEGDKVYLQAYFEEPDIVTGNMELQATRKWLLSDHMTKSEFIQTMFKLCITSAEHRCREHFRYKGSAVYSPHFDVDELEKLCKAHKFDYRDSHERLILGGANS